MIEKIEELISVLQAINGEIFLAIKGRNDPSIMEFPNIINRLVNEQMEI